MQAIHHRPPIILILDWDGTLTTRDTLSTIASIGYSKPISLRPSSRPSSPVLSSTPPWSQIVSAYTSAYAAHKDCYLPKPAERRTIAEELLWLRSLSSVERDSVERVERSGLWRGVTKDHIRNVAIRALDDGSVVLRPGWDELVSSVQRSGGRVGILSVSWSSTFIRETLRNAAQQSTPEGERPNLDVMEIWANDIEMNGDGEGSGRLTRWFESEHRGIWTGGDKARVLREIIAREADAEKNSKAMYVGDSVSDLECMVEADIGICVRDDEMTTEQRGLEEVLRRLCIGCKHISGECSSGLESEGRARELWYARDFKEIVNSWNRVSKS
jgi:thiamine phosphate phosphatase / amino-HMP aminohydrolase